MTSYRDVDDCSARRPSSTTMRSRGAARKDRIAGYWVRATNCASRPGWPPEISNTVSDRVSGRHPEAHAVSPDPRPMMAMSRGAGCTIAGDAPSRVWVPPKGIWLWCCRSRTRRTLRSPSGHGRDAGGVSLTRPAPRLVRAGASRGAPAGTAAPRITSPPPPPRTIPVIRQRMPRGSRTPARRPGSRAGRRAYRYGRAQPDR